jgi:hypothetical protein
MIPSVIARGRGVWAAAECVEDIFPLAEYGLVLRPGGTDEPALND